MVRALVLILTMFLVGCQTTAPSRQYVRIDGRSLADPALRAEMQARGRECLALAHAAATRGRSPSVVQNNVVVIEQSDRRRNLDFRDLDFIASNPATDAFREAATPRVVGDPDTLEIEMNACMARHGYILR